MDIIRIENGNAVLDTAVSSQIADFERKMKDLKAKEDELKKSILAAMEKNNVIKLETPDIVISYIASTDRETFDSKTFRKDHADLYDEYIKMTPVKPSIRVKVKA